MTDPTPFAPPQRPLLPTPVALLWFAAVLSWASGRILAQLGAFALPPVYGEPGTVGSDTPDPELVSEALRLSALQSLPTTLAVVLAAVGLALLWARRAPDPLDRVPAASAIVMAIAGALSAVGVLALVAAGPDRPIGLVDIPVGTAVALATAAAGASTAILIRPYVDVMPAHIWAGIGGAGIALPFMVAGVSPALVIAAACGLGVLDRAHGLRVERDLAFRHALERERAAEVGDAGRGVGVSGLPGRPPAPRAARPALPWSRAERRWSIGLGLGAVIVVALAWAVGSTLGELGYIAGAPGVGQGFAVAALGAVPLLWQLALSLRVADTARYGLVVTSGMLIAASLAVLTAPAAVVALIAWGLQAIAVGAAAAVLARRARGTSVMGITMLGVSTALAWWLVVVPTAGLVLAFLAVASTIYALRRKVHP